MATPPKKFRFQQSTIPKDGNTSFFFYFKRLKRAKLPLCVCVKSLSRVRLFPTPWTVARHAPLSMGYSRQEYWSGLPFPSPGDLSNPGIKPRSPALQADTLSSEPPGKPAHILPITNPADSFFVPHIPSSPFPCPYSSLSHVT